MGKLLQVPYLEHLLDGKRAILRTPYKYQMDSGEILYIPAGFYTDGASIPKAFWSIIGGPWGKYLYAALPHDYGYYTQMHTREEVDRKFLIVMKELGVSWWKYGVMHRAVRDWGWIPWKNYAKSKL